MQKWVLFEKKKNKSLSKKVNTLLIDVFSLVFQKIKR